MSFFRNKKDIRRKKLIKNKFNRRIKNVSYASLTSNSYHVQFVAMLSLTLLFFGFFYFSGSGKNTQNLNNSERVEVYNHFQDASGHINFSGEIRSLGDR